MDIYGSGLTNFSQSLSDNYKAILFNTSGDEVLIAEDVLYKKENGYSWSISVNLDLDIGQSATDGAISGNKVVVIGTNGLINVCNDIYSIITSVSVPNVSAPITDDLSKVVMYDMFRAYISGENGVILKSTISGIGDWEQRQSDPSGVTATEDIKAIAISSRESISFTGNDQYSIVVNDQADFASSMFWYDRLGRMVISQNTKQFNKSPLAWSYTVYDELGRISEVGEKANNDYVETTYSGPQIDDALLSSWLSNGAANTKTEVTHTYYDEQFASTGEIVQENLRVRVASITYEAVNDGVSLTYDYATHYSYDIHGNVDHLANEIVDLDGMGFSYTHIYYDYDLISGNVNQVDYSPGRKDEFHHKYEYDADNRITDVYTSLDGEIWDNDARYMYYYHGPLARRELGDIGIQGLDYAYTLQGWLKGVNSNTMNYSRDMGRDGDDNLGGNTHVFIARDAFGFTLGYYEGDYSDIGEKSTGDLFEADISNSSLVNNRNDLWNGNISHMVTAIPDADDYSGAYTFTPSIRGYAYKYDQLNRLAQMRSFDNINATNNTWNTSLTGSPPVYNDNSPQEFSTYYGYDANGNITRLGRKGIIDGSSAKNMDSLRYYYELNPATGNIINNRLIYVDDSVSSSYSNDIDDQNADNYDYDELGNLISDVQEEIEEITWTVYGKIKSITRTGSSTKPNLEFDYDALGNRVMKKEISNNSDPDKTTYYVRDASGNIMATYTIIEDTLRLDEQLIYGNKREAVLKRGIKMIDPECSITFDVEGMYSQTDLESEVENALTEIGVYPTFVNVRDQLLTTLTMVINEQEEISDFYVYMDDLRDFLCLFSCYPNLTDDDFDNYINSALLQTFADAGNPAYMDFDDPISINSFWDGEISDMQDLLEDNFGKCMDDEELKVTMRGMKYFELCNHLGNVLVVVSDHKIPYATGGAGYTIEYFDPEMVSISDYYPFGMQMEERTYSGTAYRFGFNGQEKDNEVKGDGNSLDFGARIYDPRLGRWLSLDPRSMKYPFLTPYNFVANSPLIFVDPNGKEIYFVDNEGNKTLLTLENITTLELGANFEGILATKDGKELINKYISNTAADIFITVGSTTNKKGESPSGRTVWNISEANGSIKTVDGKSTLSTSDLTDKYGQGIANFNGLDVGESKDKDISIIIITPENVAKKSKDGTFYQKALRGVEVLYHEMKAHVDLRTGDPNKDHDVYGAKYSAFNFKKLDPNKPVGQFIKQLSESKLKIPGNLRKNMKEMVE